MCHEEIKCIYCGDFVPLAILTADEFNLLLQMIQTQAFLLSSILHM